MTTNRFARYIVLPALSAGILGGAAIGMAGIAGAETTMAPKPDPRHSMVATPNTVARPPMVIRPRHRHLQTFSIDIPMAP